MHSCMAKITSSGHWLCGMSRLKLPLNVFHGRCDALDVDLKFSTDITDLSQLEMQNYDLVIAGGGITPMIREEYKDKFGSTMDW